MSLCRSATGAGAARLTFSADFECPGDSPDFDPVDFLGFLRVAGHMTHVGLGP